MLDVVVRHFCDLVHYFIHSRNNPLQETRLCPPRKATCALTGPEDPVARGHTCFVLSRANGQASPFAAHTPIARTNRKPNGGNAEDSL